MNIEKILNSLTDEELCAEVLVWELNSIDTNVNLDDFVRKNKVSNYFVNGAPRDKFNEMSSIVKKYTKTSELVCADVESGPIYIKEIYNLLPKPFALGAANDENLVFEAGKYTGRFGRSVGIHMTFSPVVDININKDNPIVNQRSVSDDHERVLRIAGAYGKGIDSENYMKAVYKHFPGDGVDDRNQHFCTSVNSLSKDEWDSSFGTVYSSLIKDGIDAIMVAHIALPCYDDTQDELGYIPATLSKKIMTGLLREKLGYDGCIVSDALNMIGITSRIPQDKLAIEFLRAGGDLVLFPYDNDLDNLLSALKSGYLPRERLRDAARRVLKLKEKLGLFENRIYEPTNDDKEKFKQISQNLADKSISLIRNFDNVLPLDISNCNRALVITLCPGEQNIDNDPLGLFSEELEKRGINVVRLTNPHYSKVRDIIDAVDAVFVISNIGINLSGSSLRLGWSHFMSFWRSVIFRNKNLVFISFADPYKLYELPFLKTYVNAYSDSITSIKSAVSACFGEIEFEGNNPVQLGGFFVRGK